MEQEYAPPAYALSPVPPANAPANAHLQEDRTETPPESPATLDVALMLAAQHDPTYFAHVYERYFQRIYLYCLRNVSNTHEAEDLASQVFVQAFRNLRYYRGGSVAAWLFRIAYGTVANYYRQSRSEIAIDEILPEIAGDSAEPLESIMVSEMHQKLRGLIDALSSEDRYLLGLKIEGELSSQEIGELLGKNPGAVRTQLHRIIRRIRDRYQQSEK
jgi:RNA polymerase sigma-70 factor (ECF subfamily)